MLMVLVMYIRSMQQTTYLKVINNILSGWQMDGNKSINIHNNIKLNISNNRPQAASEAQITFYMFCSNPMFKQLAKEHFQTKIVQEMYIFCFGTKIYLSKDRILSATMHSYIYIY